MAVLIPCGSERACSSQSLFPTLCGLLVSEHAGGEGKGNLSGLTIYIYYDHMDSEQLALLFFLLLLLLPLLLFHS